MAVVPIKTEYSCSGCGACAAICPEKAISLRLDTAGFFTAHVEDTLCVSCGLCKKVCPLFSEERTEMSLYEVSLFALQSKNAETVKTCTSGGIAHELAALALEEGGCAVGAAYNTEKDLVEHRIVERQAELELLDGSKYLQSKTDTAFSEVLSRAKTAPDGSIVVFGTPCQMTGLAGAAELAGVRDRLLLVELFCHGIPSYKLWESQCRKMEKKLGTKKFDAVSFRYKKDDWHSYCLRVDAGGKTYFGKRETELFWQVFFENVLLGDACYSCKFRKENSAADLRLGDYWGKAFQSRSDGVSAVFACTEMGRAAIEKLRAKGCLCELPATSVEEMLACQNMSGYTRKELHDGAMSLLRTDGIEAAVKFYRKRQSFRQKLKRCLLRISAVLPDSVRAELRKRR